MLFDEDPVSLIRQTTRNFHTQSDLSSLSRITSSLSTLRSARSLRLQAQTASLSSLSRRLHHAAQAHDDELASHDAAAHAAQILALDTDKFRVAKAASELEIEGERMSGELRGLGQVLEGLERGGVDGEDGVVGAGAVGARSARGRAEDEIVLKLRVYRSLGIDVEQDAATGDFNRAVIRNTAKGDVHVVNLDPKFSRYFYASHFWATL